MEDWHKACQELVIADAIDGGTSASRREALVAQAHILSLRSVRNWCRAARCASHQDTPDLFDAVSIAEMQVTMDFRDLVRDHPWLWDNNCWHPHQTPLSQRGLGLERTHFRDAFEAKLAVMKDAR
jgi:hypothetical protein